MLFRSPPFSPLTDCQCPKVTRNASVVRYPCSCRTACNKDHSEPSFPRRVRPTGAAQRSGAKSGAKRLDSSSNQNALACNQARPNVLTLKALSLSAHTQPLNSPNIPDRGTAGSIPGGYGEEMERGRKKVKGRMKVRSEKLCVTGGESPPSLEAKPPEFRAKAMDGKV